MKPAAEQVPYADILGNHEGTFTGFAIQQEGSQTNRYYFTYGTGSAWVYSHLIPLAADEWQHVAVTKSSTDLCVYVNGLPAEHIPARSPMAPSKTPVMAGLGIAGEGRWFTGQLAEVRVWDRVVKPSVSVSPEAQRAWFVRAARLVVETSSRWRLFGPGEANQVTFGLDAATVPEGVTRVAVALSCTDKAGGAAEFPASVELTPANGFRATVRVPAQAGFRRVRYEPVATVNGEARPLADGRFDYLVLSPRAGVAEEASEVARAEPAWAPSGRLSLDGEWLLATDPDNVGRDAGWFSAPRPEAVRTRVPWIIQDAFPEYHGVAWYWQEIPVPTNSHPGGRTLLRFGAVDYKADVWVNGQAVGGHEGGETPFTLDVTDAVKPGEANLVAVRVLNATHNRIDGIVLSEIPRRAKVIPYSAGAQYNHGGIVESVELLTTPAVYLEDLYLSPDPATGIIRCQATCRNGGAETTEATLAFAVGPATSGETLASGQFRRKLPPGESVVETALPVPQPRRWDLNDPYLYRVTARVQVDASADERSDRCGFRTFRLERGYFRLNGRRLFIRGAHTVNATPVGQQVVGDPALFQRDIVLMKTMGFNCIRFIWGGATRRQLDMCDELGMMAYVEQAAAVPMQDSPQMGERFDRSVAETILRDRSHPCVTMWGLLNETQDGPVFRHALDMLPLVRSLDGTRVVMLNSGRWDGRLDVGSLCNPGSTGWDGYMGSEGPNGGTSGWSGTGGNISQMGDQHGYPRVPHTLDAMKWLRNIGKGSAPVFLTEYGIGSAVDLWRLTRHFEQMGKPEAEDARFYRERLDRFLADFDRWHMDECFTGPDAFFAESLKRMAAQRTLGLNAIRSAPGLNGYSLTGMMDHVNCGEGLFTLFRDLKPGTTDALFEGLAPLRLCLFAEPANLYRGGEVRLEAVLANEDMLPAGEYPVRVQVVGPGTARLMDKVVSVTVPETTTDSEPPFALPFLDEELALDGPTGDYRFVATLLRGGAATGGEAVCHLTDPVDMPAVEGEVTLWGEDPELAAWLKAHGVACREYVPGGATTREVILVGRMARAPGDVAAWQDLARRIARGATVVFLCPEVFRRGDDSAGWLPLATKGAVRGIHSWLYQKDDWAKRHPVFEGLPAGGLMDAVYYREIVPDLVMSGQTPPSEAVCGAIKASQDYDSGLMVAAWNLGAGRFLANTLWVRESLGASPAAERLLRNMLRWAGRDAGKPAAELPADFETALAEIGYR
ncbi:MAG: glycoside hydrolase family 2 [Armatimonadetes bacterium]|nr:glycoside hydrolase family 2 [Armatimonadota bacterium]